MVKYLAFIALVFTITFTAQAQRLQDIEDAAVVSLLDKLFAALSQKNMAALPALMAPNVYCYSCTMKEDSDAPFNFTQKEFLSQQLSTALGDGQLFKLAAVSEEISVREAAPEEKDHADKIVYFFVTPKDSLGKAKEPVQLELHLQEIGNEMKWSGMGIVE